MTEKVTKISMIGKRSENTATIITNYAYKGGIFFFRDATELIIDATIFEGQTSTLSGALLHYDDQFTATGTPTVTLTIINSELKDSQAGTHGGLLHINNEKLTAITMTSLTITNAKALNGNGGVINIEAFDGTVSISSSKVEDINVIHDAAQNKLFEGSFLYSQEPRMTLVLN